MKLEVITLKNNNNIPGYSSIITVAIMNSVDH